MPTKEELERKNIEAERSERELNELMVEVGQAKNGETLIHFLAKENRKELLKLLLPKMSSAVLNKADKEGRTALHYAAKTGNKEALQLLLSQKGIDGNKVDKFGNTPLHLASANGNVDIVALLWSKKEIDIKKLIIWVKQLLTWLRIIRKKIY
jgi:ankyrin repeat protein